MVKFMIFDFFYQNVLKVNGVESLKSQQYYII